MVLIRPAAVFLSSTHSRFTRNEKLFMSAVGPRGIIPASVATLFAVELQANGFAKEANLLVGTVFLVILTTVVLQGGFARHIAEYLNVIPMHVIIVGGGKAGRALAERLEDRNESVVLIEKDPEQIEIARSEGFTVRKGDGTKLSVLEDANASRAKVIAAATGNDDSNLLVAQLADSNFDTSRVLARVNDPDNVTAFDDLNAEAISSTMATAWAMDNRIERPALAEWMNELGDTGDVQEVELTSTKHCGQTVGELGKSLPGECLIAMVSRDGETHVPNADYVLQQGDSVTFLGQKDAVHEALAEYHPHD